ncbi:MAG TPA: hypothetical protein VK061_03645 [Bacillota bacterium]|nr:hypothetical protein [Bacillota bacterium]
MIFWEIFKNSIKLPNKKAMRQINQVGMDYTVFYMFLLLAIISIPSFFDQVIGNNGPDIDVNIFLFTVYFFIFFYLPLVLIIFGLISLLAYISVIFANIVQRKLTFGLLWKWIAYTTTIPFVIYTLVALFYDFSVTYLAITAIYSFTLVVIMILSFPKRRT